MPVLSCAHVIYVGDESLYEERWWQLLDVVLIKTLLSREPTGNPQLENGPQHRSHRLSFHHFFYAVFKSPKRYKLIISNKTGNVRIL